LNRGLRRRGVAFRNNTLLFRNNSGSALIERPRAARVKPTMLARRLASLLFRTILIAFVGCNAIVGTEEIQFVAPPAAGAPPPSTGGDDDGTPSVTPNPTVDAQSSADAGPEPGFDGSSGDDSDASAGDFDGGVGGGDA
jgi:hypothetical protein